jgi:hypothetical protein
MMYLKERVRVYQTYVVGVIIGLTGTSLMVMSFAKAAGPNNFLYRLLSYYFPPFEWVWFWLPDVGTSPGDTLLAVPTLLGLILMLIAGGFTRYAIYFHSIISEAARATRVAGLVGGRSRASYQQSVSRVSAGGDVTITQIADANHKLDEWTHSFWKGPVGALVLSVAATIIAAVVMKLAGLTH